MREHVVVVPEDKGIAVNGEWLEFDYAAPASLRVLQWSGGSGHVEFADGRINRELTAEDYALDVAPYVVLWEAEKNRPAPPKTFAEAKEAKRREIIDKANSAKRVLAQRYSFIEENAWPRQEAGARAIMGDEANVKDDTARLILENPQALANAVALVKTLASIDDVVPEAFSSRIIANADEAHELGTLTLLEQRGYESRLNKARDVGEAEAISVVYSVLQQGG